MSDLIQRLRAADPAAGGLAHELPDAALDDLRAAILTTDVAAEVTPPAPGRRRRTAVVSMVAVVALGVGTAAAAGVFNGTPAETTGIDCRGNGREMLVIPAVTSSPVNDCAQALLGIGAAVPADLSAFQIPGRALIVVSRSAQPEGARLVTPTPVADTKVIELVNAVEDQTEGVAMGQEGSCQSLPRVTSFVRATLARIGLSGWQVVAPTGRTSCVWPLVEMETKTVRLMPMPAERKGTPIPIKPGQPDPFRFDKELKALSATCLPLSQAKKAVLAAARRSQIPDSAIRFTTTEVPAYRCTHIYNVPGGQFDVRFFGPSKVNASPATSRRSNGPGVESTRQP